jgi:hypothetical protein
MDFTEPNWLSIFKLNPGFSLHHWLCVYFAIFPLLSGCELLNNIPCMITHYETQIMVLKFSFVTSSIDSHINPTAERNCTGGGRGGRAAGGIGVSLFLLF